jgi:hypothetical protein
MRVAATILVVGFCMSLFACTGGAGAGFGIFVLTVILAGLAGAAAIVFGIWDQ